MLGVVEDHRQWVTKDRRGFLECDAVFLLVAPSFVVIPFKFGVHAAGSDRATVRITGAITSGGLRGIEWQLVQTVGGTEGRNTE